MFPVIDVPVRFRLREILANREPKMTQSELAERAGVSFMTVNNIANNRTSTVALDTLDALSKVLECEPGELLVRAPGRRRAKR